MWHTLKSKGLKFNLGVNLMRNLLTTKTKNKIKSIHLKTYHGIKNAAYRLKSFLFDPNDLAPGDDFPNGPLLFLQPKKK